MQTRHIPSNMGNTSEKVTPLSNARCPDEKAYCVRHNFTRFHGSSNSVHLLKYKSVSNQKWNRKYCSVPMNSGKVESSALKTIRHDFNCFTLVKIYTWLSAIHEVNISTKKEQDDLCPVDRLLEVHTDNVDLDTTELSRVTVIYKLVDTGLNHWYLYTLLASVIWDWYLGKTVKPILLIVSCSCLAFRARSPYAHFNSFCLECRVD